MDCFTLFKSDITKYKLPRNFTFPFYYEPNPLCIQACTELQVRLKLKKDWECFFEENGKMFGVLIVQKNNKEIGYISAFSGKLKEKNIYKGFVPPVYNILTKDGFYKKGEAIINKLNLKIEKLEQHPKVAKSIKDLKINKIRSANEIRMLKEFIKKGKEERKIIRDQVKIDLENKDAKVLIEELNKESIKEKLNLRNRSIFWNKKLSEKQKIVDNYTEEIQQLKIERKSKSKELQNELFKSYHFLNQKGEIKSLIDIFKDLSYLPSAAGECAAPKLLQYAFKQNLKPIAMAEFWWGASPQSEIRKHGSFYPSCQAKCKPILGHMLKGIKLDKNPMLANSAIGKKIHIIYEEEDFLVLNKPTDLLSVPGKNIYDSVYSRVKEKYPNASGPLIVHRLDMSTSGLMLIAKNKDTHKHLQRQFIKKSVKKRYVAILQGLLKEKEGVIDLPVRVDLDDRPRQLVCYKYGKSARTKWETIEKINNYTRVYFYPITGRTHQLRVHASHLNGLNTPILGDDLYGNKEKRLYLHANRLEIIHPKNKQTMIFESNAEF